MVFFVSRVREQGVRDGVHIDEDVAVISSAGCVLKSSMHTFTTSMMLKGALAKE